VVHSAKICRARLRRQQVIAASTNASSKPQPQTPCERSSARPVVPEDLTVVGPELVPRAFYENPLTDPA
jgi:hypothetical protein